MKHFQCSMPAIGLLLVLAGPTAEGSVPGSYSLPLMLLGDYLVVPMELSSKTVTQSVSLLVDLTEAAPLVLREDMLQDLKLGEGEVSLTMHVAAGLEVQVARERIKPYAGQSALANLSTRHAALLDDRPIAGAIGVGFLRNHQVTIDVQAGELRLLPDASPAENSDAALASPVTVRDDGILVPVVTADGKALQMLLASTGYDSTARASIALADDAKVKIAGAGRADPIDLSRHVAFRRAQQDVSLRSGVNLFEDFRIQIDWRRQQVAFTETRLPRDLSADRAFFALEVAGEPAQLTAFIERYPASRFRLEAARLLLDRSLAAGADDAAVADAARGYMWTIGEESRGEQGLSLLRRLIQEYPHRPALLIRVGELALESMPQKKAPPQERYRLLQILGDLRLREGDLKGAWPDSLAAVFGLPQDAQVNLDLARVYEKQGRLRRAYSRYRFTYSLIEKQADALTQVERAEVEVAVKRLSSKVDAHGP